MAALDDDPTALNEGDGTALHIAAESGDDTTVRWLLENGANPNQTDFERRSPLHMAAECNSVESIDHLLAAGATTHARQAHLEHSPLHRAALFGAAESTEHLLKAGADPNARDSLGDAPIHHALSNLASEDHHLPTIDSLIKGGADLDLPETRSGETPLIQAAMRGKLKTVDRLLQAGADPNTPDKDGHTPLHAAARLSSPTITERLLEAGASPHTPAKNGHKPLHEAASYSSPASAERLLQAGADPDCRTATAQTPLHLAANSKSSETVGRLIDAGADPNARNDRGSTPLHSATLANCTKSIERLLKAGADMRSHEPGGVETPQELARSHGKADAVEHLARAETARDSVARTIGRRLFQHIADRLPHHANEKESRTISSTSPNHNRKENTMPQEHWSNSKSARQHTEQVAARVAGQIEKGNAPMQKGYDKPKGADLQPFNPATGKRFKGLNSVQLRSVAQEKGYNDPRWMSYNTTNRVGAKIRKGERGTRVEYLRFPPKEKTPTGKNTPEAAGGDKQKEQPKISHHTYVVFNAEQIDRMPALEKQLAKEPQQHEVCERAERMIQDSGVKIKKPPNGQDFSHYDKGRDTIVISEMEKFKTPEAYYSQAVKEMAGREGHEQQKDRPEPQSEAQQHSATSRHEMRREMACQTISSKLHLPKEPAGEQHQKQWAETIRNNPNELRYAARDADRMADKVLQHDRPQQRSQTGPSRETVAAPPTPERMQETQRAVQQQPQREMAAMNR